MLAAPALFSRPTRAPRQSVPSPKIGYGPLPETCYIFAAQLERSVPVIYSVAMSAPLRTTLSEC
jgi:hypothetical protein